MTFFTALYPSASLRFIQREVDALRVLGLDVDVVSVRTPEPTDVHSDEDRRSFAQTTYLRPVRIGTLLAAHATAAVRSPGGYVRTLREALGRGGWDLRGVLWQFFYFVQAIMLWRMCEQGARRRLHVHFANVAADITMLAVAFGRRERSDDGAWSWSFTMHGPTEFAEVSRYHLADKASAADGVACISHYCQSQLMTITQPAVWDRFEVIRLGIEPTLGQVGGAADPASRSDPTDPVRLLSVGRLVPEKGFAVLLRALAQLPSNRDWSLQVVGTGPDEQTLHKLAADLGLASRVHFHGALGNDEVQRLYAASDAFCLASFAEGLPVVLMEAMAWGLPVVTTRITAVPELIVDGESGVLVSPGDVAGLAAALDHVLGDAARRDRLGTRARARVHELHDLERNAATLREFLARVHGR